MPGSSLSPELRQELIGAMQVFFMTSPGSATENDRLATVMIRVGLESRHAGVSAEAMVIALRHVFEEAVADHVRYHRRARDDYDRFLTGCIRAYYGHRPTPTA